MEDLKGKQREIARADARSKRLIHRFMVKWKPRMGLRLWSITTHYDFDRSTNSRDNAGEAQVQWQYLQGSITYFLPAIRNMREDEIEELVVHELAHMLTDPIADFSDDDKTAISELVTSNIAIALMLTADDGPKRPQIRVKTKPKKS